MKVLKSGIEMTPAELKKMKGGACACGCDFSAESLHASSESGGGCVCNCKGGSISETTEIFRGGGTSALTYL